MLGFCDVLVGGSARGESGFLDEVNLGSGPDGADDPRAWDILES